VQPRRAVSGRAVRLDPPAGKVAGREDLLAELHARLSDSTGTPQVVAMAGMGGVGKTTAALEYAHRHLSDYAVVWQFHAEEDTGMLSQFHDLALVLDVDDGGDPVAAVHTALTVHPGRGLLMLDNVPDHAAARRWIPPAGDVHVLVTTTDGNWPAGQLLSVGALGAAQGAEFLMDDSGSVDVASAQALAEELDGLPLALAQAAAYCRATGRSLAEYLHLLRTDQAKVLARYAPAGHADPVTTTWSLAMAQLETDSLGAITLLRISAHLAPDGIPFRLLLQHSRARLPRRGMNRRITKQVRTLCRDSLALDDAVAALRSHSLIGPAGQTFGVHRLVQAVTRNRMPADDRRAWRRTAAALVEAAVPPDTSVREAWPVCQLLLPHAQAAANLLGKPMWRLADFLGSSGDYAAARAQWDTLANAYTTRLGLEHPDTLTARANLAFWTGEAGDPAAARDLYAELLPMREKISGPKHPDTLSTRACLATWTGEAGDAAAARDLYAELLPIQEKVLGPQHPDTLAISANIARWSQQAETS
jgi:hypothetical protein